MGNQVIHVREDHHRWLKEKAAARGVSMQDLLTMLIEAGMALDHVPAVRRGCKRAGER